MKNCIFNFLFTLLISSFLVTNSACSQKTEKNINIPEEL